MLDLYTVIWGRMINSFLEVTLPSLMQPGNIPGAKDLLGSYNFYASPNAKNKIEQSELYSQLDQIVEVRWFPMQKGPWETTSNTLFQMKLSAKEGRYMLIMAPDNAIGNDSITNMAKLCNGEYNPILFGFPRVDDHGWDELRKLYDKQIIVSNRKLVSLAMKYIGEIAYPIKYMIASRIIHHNTWIVRHNVPTLCLLPDKKTIDLFATNPTKNAGFDHVIPFSMVKLGYPWHFIKHSDIYFQVERGRHLLQEGIGPDTEHWNDEINFLGANFFVREEEIWQGT